MTRRRWRPMATLFAINTNDYKHVARIARVATIFIKTHGEIVFNASRPPSGATRFPQGTFRKAGASGDTGDTSVIAKAFANSVWRQTGDNWRQPHRVAAPPVQQCWRSRRPRGLACVLRTVFQNLRSGQAAGRVSKHHRAPDASTIALSGATGEVTRSAMSLRVLLGRTSVIEVAARCRVTPALVTAWASGAALPPMHARLVLEAVYQISRFGWDVPSHWPHHVSCVSAGFKSAAVSGSHGRHLQ